MVAGCFGETNAPLLARTTVDGEVWIGKQDMSIGFGEGADIVVDER